MKREHLIQKLEKDIQSAKLLEPETEKAKETVRKWLLDKQAELDSLKSIDSEPTTKDL